MYICENIYIHSIRKRIQNTYICRYVKNNGREAVQSANIDTSLCPLKRLLNIGMHLDELKQGHHLHYERSEYCARLIHELSSMFTVFRLC